MHSLHYVLSSDSIDFVHHKSKNVINARTSMIDWLIDLVITSQRLIANVINGPSFKEPNLLIEKTCTFDAAVVVCWANGAFMVRHYPKLQSAWSKSFMGNSDPWPALGSIQSQPPTQRNAKISQKKHLKIGTKKCCFSVYSRHQNTLQDVKSNKSLVTSCDEVQNLSKLVITLMRFCHGCWQ